ncbi:glycosyltransferase family 1 protein [Zhongshania borealis]
MKINYDFSNMGRTLITGGGVNGITRVIDELSLAMWRESLQDSCIDLVFSSDFYPQARRTIEKYYLFKGGGVELNRDSALNEFIYYLFVNFKMPFHKGKKLGSILSYSDSVSPVDISLSPFLPVSKKRRDTSKLVFNVIHDIISETSPKYFTEDHVLSMRDVYRDIIRNTDYFFAVSSYTKFQLCEYFNIHESRVFVTPLAISSSFYDVGDSMHYNDIRRKYGIGIGQKYILCIATIEPRKNIDTLLKSYISLESELARNGIKLVVCGSYGWEYSSTLELLRSSKILQENAIFTGYVLDEDIVAIYSGAMVFCYVPFEEGFGLPPLEAMAAGTAVICSKTSSLPEVVGDAAVLVDPLSVDDVSSAILSLVNDDDYRSSLVLRGLVQSRKFSWQATAREMFDVFRNKIE